MRGTSYEGTKPAGGDDAGGGTPSERRVALVIGNARYDHGRTLANPHADAAAVAGLFARLGFQLSGPADSSKSWHADLGLIEMRRVLADFGVMAETADMAIIYFAGHGMEVDGENYLLPKDCKLEHVRRIRAETVALSELLEDVQRVRRLPLVILDACRVNEFAQRIRGLETTRSFRGGLADMDPPGDVLVAYAARAGAPALDGEGSANSPYASALVQHLGTPDVDIRFLFGRVRDTVRDSTGGKQVPHLYASLGGEEIILAHTSEAPPASDKAENTNLLAWSQREWQVLIESGNLQDLKEFVAHAHPYYVSRAEKEIERRLSAQSKGPTSSAKGNGTEAVDSLAKSSSPNKTSTKYQSYEKRSNLDYFPAHKATQLGLVA